MSTIITRRVSVCNSDIELTQSSAAEGSPALRGGRDFSWDERCVTCNCAKVHFYGLPLCSRVLRFTFLLGFLQFSQSLGEARDLLGR